MNKQEMFDHLHALGAKPEYGRAPITSNLIWAIVDGTPVVAVGGDLEYDAQVHAVIDAVFWSRRRQSGRTALVRLVYGSGPRDTEVMESVATLMAVFQGPECLQVERDFRPIRLSLPDFAKIDGRWARLVEKRATAVLPPLAVDLGNLVNEPAFRWYRTVTGGYWSGRVDGLEVCRVTGNPGKGDLDVGRVGKGGAQSREREVFEKIAASVPRDFDMSNPTNMQDVAEVIRSLVRERESGELKKVSVEHRLEARVLRGRVLVNDGQVTLTTVCGALPFQFPTKWSEIGAPRYVDVLMKKDDVPYVVELKVGTAGIGQYYRHAITQAVLYREFIRRAPLFHNWFTAQGLDCARCRAVVAFPRDSKSDPACLTELRRLAGAFDVEVIEVSDA